MPDNNLLMIPRAVVKAALHFMPHDHKRYYLNGLHVQVSGGDVMFVACNGWTFFRYTIPAYEGVDDLALTIPHYIVKLALSRAVKEKQEFLPLDVDDRFLGDIGFRPIMDKYPIFDLHQLRQGKKAAGQTYDIDLLQHVQRANNLLGDGGPVLGKLVYYGQCAVLDIDDNALVLVMPTAAAATEEAA